MKKIFQIVIFALLAFSLGSLCQASSGKSVAGFVTKYENNLEGLNDVLSNEQGKKDPDADLVSKLKAARQQILEKQAQAQGLTQQQIETARALGSGGGGGQGRVLSAQEEELLALSKQKGVQRALEALRQQGGSLGGVPVSTTSQVLSTPTGLPILQPPGKGLPPPFGGPVGKGLPLPPPPPSKFGFGAPTVVLKTATFHALEAGGQDLPGFDADKNVLKMDFSGLFPSKTVSGKSATTITGQAVQAPAVIAPSFIRDTSVLKNLGIAHKVLAKKPAFAVMLTDLGPLEKASLDDLSDIEKFLNAITDNTKEDLIAGCKSFLGVKTNNSALLSSVEQFIVAAIDEVTVGSKNTRKLDLCKTHIKFLQAKLKYTEAIAEFKKSYDACYEFNEYIKSAEFKAIIGAMIAIVNNFKKGPITGGIPGIKSISLKTLNSLKNCLITVTPDPNRVYLVNNLFDAVVVSLPSAPTTRLMLRYSKLQSLETLLLDLKVLQRFLSKIENEVNAADILNSTNQPQTLYGSDQDFIKIKSELASEIGRGEPLLQESKEKFTNLVRFFNIKDGEEETKLFTAIEDMNSEIHERFGQLEKLVASRGKNLTTALPLPPQDWVL